MKYKRLNLFLIAVLMVILFFTIPTYNKWLYTNVLGLNILEQSRHLDEEERKAYRYGNIYTVYRSMAKTLSVVKDPIVLLPPNGYLKYRHISFISPEPAVFYYYSGLHAVCVSSPDVEAARWELVFRNGDKMSIIKIKSKEHLDSLITFYRQFKEF